MTIGFVIGLIVGTGFGVFIMSLMAVAADNSRQLERDPFEQWVEDDWHE